MRLLIFILCFPTIVFATDEIRINFTKENSKYWQYISDQTMGGVSNGQATLEKEDGLYFARLIGQVSTKNNGGFIQLRSTLPFVKYDKDLKKLNGVKLKVRGNGEIYNIFIRTSETRSYRDYYSANFIAGEKWEVVDLPFTQFKNKFSKKNLDGNDIRTFGIVAYGRDFVSDVSVSEIILY